MNMRKNNLIDHLCKTGQKEVAIELYRKGIRELELGIAVDCWGGRGEIYERAQRLHDKMQTNLSMARDRLHFLGNAKNILTYKQTNEFEQRFDIIITS